MTSAPLRVALVGGSGFLGQAIRSRLVADGHRVIVIGRGQAAEHDGWRSVTWNGTTLGPWVEALEGADVVVHLAGKRVDCRPTAANLAELISSREDTVRLVGEAVQRLVHPPSSWIQLSSLAIFGDSGEEIITEASTPPETGVPQQVEVCQRWEAAYRQATSGLDRTVLLRPAIGLGGSGDPATTQLARLARLGLAGPVGGGRQWVSWIGAEDLFDFLVQSVVSTEVQGLYHLAAPEPVRNEELMAAYRAAVGRRFGLSTPAPLTRLGAWLLGSDPSLALTGRHCLPQRLLDEDYQFKTTDIRQAVADAVATT